MQEGLAAGRQALPALIRGCAATKVVHIGDSYDIDVVGALDAGIRPVQQYGDVETVDGLSNLIFINSFSNILIIFLILPAFNFNPSPCTLKNNLCLFNHFFDLF